MGNPIEAGDPAFDDPLLQRRQAMEAMNSSARGLQEPVAVDWLGACGRGSIRSLAPARLPHRENVFADAALHIGSAAAHLAIVQIVLGLAAFTSDLHVGNVTFGTSRGIR